MSYDDWKTTEPSDDHAEDVDAIDAAEHAFDAAYDAAADLRSLFESLGFYGEIEPLIEAKRARLGVYIETGLVVC